VGKKIRRGRVEKGHVALGDQTKISQCGVIRRCNQKPPTTCADLMDHSVPLSFSYGHTTETPRSNVSLAYEF
jgi:hypothetical protein